MSDGSRCPHLRTRCHTILILLPECNCASTSQLNSSGAPGEAAWNGGLTFSLNLNEHAADVVGICHDQPGIITTSVINPLQISSPCIDPQYLNIFGPPHGGYNPTSSTYVDFGDTSPAVENTQAASNEEDYVDETRYFGLINLALSATETEGDPNVNDIVQGYFNMVIDSPFFGYPGDANPQPNNHHDFNYPQVDNEELGDIQEEHWYGLDFEYSQKPEYNEEPHYNEELPCSEKLEYSGEPEHNQQAPEDKSEDEAPKPAAAAATVPPSTARNRILVGTRHTAGLCLYCGKVNPDRAFKGCPDCMARRRKLERARYKRRKEAKLLQKPAERENGYE